MAIGENISTIAEASRQRFREKYGKKPDLERVHKDFRKNIILLAFCSILIVAGIAGAIYRVYTIDQTKTELMVFLIGVVMGFFAVCVIISNLLTVKCGMDEYKRNRIRTPDLVKKMTGPLRKRKPISSPTGLDRTENEGEAEEVLSEKVKPTEIEWWKMFLPDNMSAEELKQFERLSADIGQLKKEIYHMEVRHWVKREIIKLFPKDLDEAYPYIKSALKILIVNAGLDEELRKFCFHYDGNGKLVKGVRKFNLRPNPEDRVW